MQLRYAPFALDAPEKAYSIGLKLGILGEIGRGWEVEVQLGAGRISFRGRCIDTDNSEFSEKALLRPVIGASLAKKWRVAEELAVGVGLAMTVSYCSHHMHVSEGLWTECSFTHRSIMDLVLLARVETDFPLGRTP